MCLFDVRNRLVGLYLGACSNVDFGIFGVEDPSQFLADTGIRAGNNVDLWESKSIGILSLSRSAEDELLCPEDSAGLCL